MTEHIQATTLHARRGALKNAFTYGVDFVLTDLEDGLPMLISRNRFNLWSLHDSNHGGTRGHGSGKTWFRTELVSRGFPIEGARLVLLTQPSFLWFHFNPVSFWIALKDEKPCAFIAEVNSTFGQRHCYFCAHEDFRPIEKGDWLTATKQMHVSPFQKVEGTYFFHFVLDERAIDIRIRYENGHQGVLATLSGNRQKVTNRSLLWAAIRRPAGALRVLALIHWQAMILWVKRAPFLGRQTEPPTLTTSGCPVEAAGK